jgi:hypothetical protein
MPVGGESNVLAPPCPSPQAAKLAEAEARHEELVKRERVVT